MFGGLWRATRGWGGGLEECGRESRLREVEAHWGQNALDDT